MKGLEIRAHDYVTTYLGGMEKVLKTPASELPVFVTVVDASGRRRLWRQMVYTEAILVFQEMGILPGDWLYVSLDPYTGLIMKDGDRWFQREYHPNVDEGRPPYTPAEIPDRPVIPGTRLLAFKQGRTADACVTCGEAGGYGGIPALSGRVELSGDGKPGFAKKKS